MSDIFYNWIFLVKVCWNIFFTWETWRKDIFSSDYHGNHLYIIFPLKCKNYTQQICLCDWQKCSACIIFNMHYLMTLHNHCWSIRLQWSNLLSRFIVVHWKSWVLKLTMWYWLLNSWLRSTERNSETSLNMRHRKYKFEFSY